MLKNFKLPGPRQPYDLPSRNHRKTEPKQSRHDRQGVPREKGLRTDQALQKPRRRDERVRSLAAASLQMYCQKRVKLRRDHRQRNGESHQQRLPHTPPVAHRHPNVRAIEKMMVM